MLTSSKREKEQSFVLYPKKIQGYLFGVIFFAGSIPYPVFIKRRETPRIPYPVSFQRRETPRIPYPFKEGRHPSKDNPFFKGSLLFFGKKESIPSFLKRREVSLQPHVFRFPFPVFLKGCIPSFEGYLFLG